jgi:hypothetical protein
LIYIVISWSGAPLSTSVFLDISTVGGIVPFFNHCIESLGNTPRNTNYGETV